MSPPTVAVRPVTFSSAAREFEAIHDEISNIIDHLFISVSGSRSMAGTDDAGRKFAGAYDPALNGPDGAFAGLALLGNAAGKMAELLDASAVNHANADNAFGRCTPTNPMGEVMVPHELPTLSVGSSFGGPGQPSNWEQLEEFVQGMAFPDGDPEILEQVSNAWRRAATDVRRQGQRIGPAINMIAGEQSVEVTPAQDQADLLARHMDGIAGALDTLADVTSDYGRRIEEVREQTSNEVRDLTCELITAAAIGVALVLVTGGLSGVLASAAGVARATATGARIASFIRSFLSATEIVIRPTMYVMDPMMAAAGDLGGLLGSRATIFGVDLTASALRAEGLAHALNRLPHWQRDRLELAADPAKLEQRLVDDGMPADLAREAAMNSPYRDLAPDQIVDRYWDEAAGSWKWPADNGFAAPPQVSDRIPADIHLDRLGLDSGGFLGSAGDTYGQRALAPGTDTGYSMYAGTGRVLPPDWVLLDGPVAPAFGQPGGGHQWVVIDRNTGEEVSIVELLEKGVLE